MSLWFLIIAASIALILGTAARVRHRRCLRCDCGERFDTEEELDAHLDEVGRCGERSGSHTCVQGGHKHEMHACACGMEWS